MSEEKRDFYNVLGIDRSASPDQIKKAYRKRARKLHPDVNKAADAQKRFSELQEAYEVLHDPETRKKYDQFGANWKQGASWTSPPDGARTHSGFRRNAEEADLHDFFRQAFGGMGDFAGFTGGAAGFGGSGPRRGRAHESPFSTFQQPGVDQEAEIEVSLAEAFHGTKKTVRLATQSLTPEGMPETKNKSLTVTIPKGVADGSRIRLHGQGGGQAGQAGDLYLRIRLRPDPRFRVEGHDLRTTVRLTPWQAALGAEVAVPTLSGTVQLKIPAGTSTGKTLRLRGKGLPSQSGTPGNLFAEIEVHVPRHLSAKEKALYQQLAELAAPKAEPA